MKDKNKHLLNFIIIICQLYLYGIHCSPLPLKSKTIVNEKASFTKCPHVSVAELVKTSPVILKALAVHIFSETITNNQHFPNPTKTILDVGEHSKNNKVSFQKTATLPGTLPDSQSIMLTLVPETIYRGDALIPVGTDSYFNDQTLEDDDAGFNENNGQYASQLNATLQPLACFDGSILRILPTKIIAFGKLVSLPQYKEFGEQLNQNQMRVIHIKMHGFYSWTQQLENHVWQLLGWDDWSDFTPCSVTCGRGLQQRYRRCLLDNPMINLNHNSFNDDDVDVDVDDDNDTYKTDSTMTDFKAHTLRETNNTITLQQKMEWHNGSGVDILESNNYTKVVGDLSNTLLNDNAKQQIDTMSSTLTNSTITNSKRKITLKKGISTIFCEGFNVEQRSCNTFECTDDISDLLRLQAKSNDLMHDDDDDNDSKDEKLIQEMHIKNMLLQLPNKLNMSNTRNYTIMLTLRAQNLMENNEVIFTLSNDTQSLRMTAMLDGLLLHVVSSHGRKMKLPIKFNLSDYHWHKVAISIRNGNFLTVHVDCIWMKSIVLPRHLAELPLQSVVQIGINFRNDVQQLIILPYNEGNQQCSSQRKSINEVKRYIIDTFITN